MKTTPALLLLADGSMFRGYSVGAPGQACGELVFNTAMTGYQEVISDPSYSGQIVTLTTAHVGNTGCNFDDMESTKAWVSGVVMRECSVTSSHYRAEQSFPAWLKKQGIVAIAGLDTRELTHRLREHGAINACISTYVDKPELAKELLDSFSGLSGLDLAQTVSRQQIESWTHGCKEWAWFDKTTEQRHVVVYDFGVKESILNHLYDLGCRITIVPAKTKALDVIEMKPDGIVLSNGPGDPAACRYAIESTQFFLNHAIPLFGICLGFQILALACGASAYKMKFGHHGANHPVIELGGAGRVLITSQNHGFAIDEATLPSCLQVTHRSLFDSSLQGIIHSEKPALGFQGHPEASPGPHDLDDIFLKFIKMMG